MMSNIDPSQPTYGNATTQSVRDNFTIAKSEIEALQAALAAGGGGGGGGGGTSAADIEAYFASRPTSDAGLATNKMFWDGGFLCKKV
jgi:hypothetical protein